MWWQRRSFAAKDAAGRARLSQWVGMAAGLAFVAAAHPMTAVAAGTRVLLLDPQPADKTTKLWPELRALVTKTMADYVGRSGEYSLVRLQPGTAVGCEAIDFACFARGATAKSEFVLGAKGPGQRGQHHLSDPDALRHAESRACRVAVCAIWLASAKARALPRRSGSARHQAGGDDRHPVSRAESKCSATAG
jgi:hypothetical protein